MAEGLAAQPAGKAFVSSIAAAVDTRKQKFAQMLEAKLEQGYEIEAQGETDAVLFTRGSWFGLFVGRSQGARQLISVDDQGAAKTRKLSPNETSESGRGKKPRAS
jgi:hypothetical protein